MHTTHTRQAALLASPTNKPYTTDNANGMPAEVGTHKVAASAYGLPGRWATVTTYAPSNRGRNARGTSGAKRGYGGAQPKGAKRAKRQDGTRMGNAPTLRSTNWDTTYAKRERTVADVLGLDL